MSKLKNLNYLDISHNKIVDIFDFDPSAKLEVVDYSYNCVREIQNVNKNRFI